MVLSAALACIHAVAWQTGLWSRWHAPMQLPADSARQRKASGSGRSGSGKSPKPNWIGSALSGVEDTIPEASMSPANTMQLLQSKAVLHAASATPGSGSNRSSRPPSIGLGVGGTGSRLPSTQQPILTPGMSHMSRGTASMEQAQTLSTQPPKPSSPNFVNEVEAKLQEAEQLLERQLRLRRPGSSTQSDRHLPRVAAPPSREVCTAGCAALDCWNVAAPCAL